MDTNTAFALGLITSALQMIFVMLSWILTTFYGRRSIYLWGSAVNTVLLIALGIAGTVDGGKTRSAELASASLGLIVSVLFTLGPAPASWVIIGETSAIRLRPLTTGIGRATYYIVEIPCIFRKFPPISTGTDLAGVIKANLVPIVASYMLNPTGGNRKSFIDTLTSIQQSLILRSGCQVRLRLGRYRPVLSHRGIL